ncbi:MAG: sodium:proton antiporter [Thiotrichales bacterium]|nr:sodium:proton antiporter [Thiotrichales bacterium]
MFTSQAFLFFLALLALAVIVEPVCKRLKVPYPIALVVIGYIGSEITVSLLDIDTGIRWHNFHTIIFHGFIPILIFQAALTLNIPAFKKDALAITVMAFPVMLCATVLTGTIIFFGIDHPVGFPWIAALLTGALLSATDPAAVLAVLKDAGTPGRVRSLLEGESLFNDAIAIVLFMVLLGMAANSTVDGSWTDITRQFLGVFAGGVIVGVLVAVLAHLILNCLKDKYTFTVITLVSAYGSYIIAEDLYHVSGVMAVLSAGLTLRYYEFQDDGNGDTARTGSVAHSLSNVENCRFFWNVSSHVSEIMIFLLAGITITVSMFTDQWLAIMIGIVAVTISRLALIFPVLGVLGKLPWTEPVTVRDQFIIGWGGVRGTVTLALALSLPLTLDYYYTIQSIAYGVVLFTLFIQATTIRLIVKR